MHGMKTLMLSALLVPLMLAATGCSRGADNRSVLHRETEVAELEAKIAALEDALEMAKAMPTPVVEAEPTAPGINDDLAGTGATVSERGNEIVITVGNEILFSSGSATLTASAKRSLKQIVDAINARYPSNDIRIVGHTDNQPVSEPAISGAITGNYQAPAPLLCCVKLSALEFQKAAFILPALPSTSPSPITAAATDAAKTAAWKSSSRSSPPIRGRWFSHQKRHEEHEGSHKR